MTQFMAIPVPAIPPRPPQLSLLNSAIVPKPGGEDPGGVVFEIGSEQLALLPDELRDELEARKGDSWVRGFTYAPENHSAAELRDRCDFSTVDAPALPAPQNLVATPVGSGGTLAAGLKTYEVTAVNANGETTPSTAATCTTVLNGQATLTWQADGDSSGTTYKVYGRVAGSLGLLATVGPFDDDQTPTYTDTGAATPGAVPPSSNTTGGPGSYTNLPIVTVIPYVMMVQDRCSTFGFSERDFKGRALRLLDAAQHQAIEREFWTGAFAQAKGYPNPYLAQSSATDLTPGTVPTVARAAQILQDALQQCGFGGQGMIHCQAQAAPNLLNARRVGNLLLDVFDNIVVPGVGYPGTGPVGNANQAPPAGQTWLFASDLAMARVEDEGTVFAESFAEATDWGQGGQPNSIAFQAQKFGAAYFDGACLFACRGTVES